MFLTLTLSVHSISITDSCINAANNFLITRVYQEGFCSFHKTWYGQTLLQRSEKK